MSEPLLILGVESSCDETAASVVADGRRIMSNVVASQIDLHSAYGGVVPEIASRAHVEQIIVVIRQALAEEAERPGPRKRASLLGQGQPSAALRPDQR